MSPIRSPRALLERRRLSRPGPPAPFIVGMTRSGTTLLRMMLDAHPELTIPPETHFVPDIVRKFRKHPRSPKRVMRLLSSNRRWGDFGIDEQELRRRLARLAPLDAGLALRAFYTLYAERHQKPRWGDKTPGYITRMRAIEGALPEARFVHMIRDGRDVALSIQRSNPKPEGIKRLAARWANRIERGRELGPQLTGYVEVRYEELVAEPERELRRVCELIELDFDPVMLDYHEHAEERLREIERPLEAEKDKLALDPEERLAFHERVAEPPRADRIGAWRHELTAEQIETFEGGAGETLAALGYELAS